MSISDVTNDDELPKQFCYDCCVNIELSHAFIKKARKTDITLKNLVFRSESSVIVEMDSLSRTSTIQYQGIESNEISYDNQSDNTMYLQNEELLSNLNNVLEKQSESAKFGEPLPNLTSENNTRSEVNIITKNVNLNESSSKCVDQNKVVLKSSDELKLNTCPICRKEFSSKTWFAKHVENEHVNNKPASNSDYGTDPDYDSGHAIDLSPSPYSNFTLVTFLILIPVCAGTALRNCQFEGSFGFCRCCISGVQTSAGNLTVHMRTHSGLKPHQCAQCGFASAAASSLRRHRLRHAEIRHYSCNSCQKRFYDASGLQRHLRVHSGETPYQCPLCSQCFSDSWKRKSHMMRQHRLRLTDIPRMKVDGQRI
ncbi:Zinc finger protein 566 [Eumeta japonica]|uniref:Zinc finger protein 566 n=1 Tax=Eumeta variegata TaxID=151549 RepID=A0A4C1TTN6_EUMVA|nr:Zinc finger protein 566 [Eumeta japonica]